MTHQMHFDRPARLAGGHMSAHLLLGQRMDEDDPAIVDLLSDFAAPDTPVRASFSPLPMPADTFFGAISPLAGAADRAALTDLIAHHECHVTVTLPPKSPLSPANGLDALQQIAAVLADNLLPDGLYWAPTHRLHHRATFRPLLHMADPLPLFLAPVLATMGPRRLPVMYFAGSEARLGFALVLHLIDIDRHTAMQTGMAFARAVIANPALRAGGMFHNDGHSYRVAGDISGHAVSLLPQVDVPHSTDRFAAPLFERHAAE